MDGVKSINFNNDALKGDKHKIDDFLNNADAIVGGSTGGAGNAANEANDISESTFATDNVDIDADIDIDIDDIDDIINTESSVQDIEDKVCLLYTSPSPRD